MADNQVNEALVAQVMKQVMGQANGLLNNTGAMPAMQGMQPPQNALGAINPTGWSVPVETDMGGSTVTVYVQFPANTFPQYQQIIAQLLNMGYNVRAFAKNNGFGGNNGGYGRGGSWGGSWGNRGGYGRGGYGWGR